MLARPVAVGLVTRIREPIPATLTSREAQVLALVARRLTNANIGRALFISEATVETHLLHVFAKLNVGDRTAAVTFAIERGLLPELGR